MEPSSLIFLVIIGIWGAYFVQYWVRRREHLATIRSVDAFSETMRVLQVRAPLPSVDTGSSRPRTSAVSPARAMRPQVTVKRAEAYAASPTVAGSVPTTSSTSTSTSSATSTVGSASAGPVARSSRLDDVAVPSMSPSRATRGIVLLVGLAGTLVFGLLAAVGVLVGWAFVVPLLMAVGGFVWLRSGVQAEARARRAARGRARRAAARTVGTPATTAVPATRAAAPPSTSTHRTEVEAEVVTPAAPVDAPAAPAPYDVSAHSLAEAVADTTTRGAVPVPVVEHEVVAPELDEDDIPLTWDPRPVPRPTYTMKARAPQRPAPQAEPAAAPERTAYEDEAPQRRIVGG